MKHDVYSKQYSLAKRADKIGYYLVFMTYIGCTSSKSMVSTWIVSYLLVYTWHTPLHYPHAANAGCVLAGVAPVIVAMVSCVYVRTSVLFIRCVIKGNAPVSRSPGWLTSLPEMCGTAQAAFWFRFGVARLGSIHRLHLRSGLRANSACKYISFPKLRGG